MKRRRLDSCGSERDTFHVQQQFSGTHEVPGQVFISLDGLGEFETTVRRGRGGSALLRHVQGPLMDGFCASPWKVPIKLGS